MKATKLTPRRLLRDNAGANFRSAEQNQYQRASALCTRCYDRAPINARPKLSVAAMGVCSLCGWHGSVSMAETKGVQVETRRRRTGR